MTTTRRQTLSKLTEAHLSVDPPDEGRQGKLAGAQAAPDGPQGPEGPDGILGHEVSREMSVGGPVLNTPDPPGWNLPPISSSGVSPQ